MSVECEFESLKSKFLPFKALRPLKTSDKLKDVKTQLNDTKDILCAVSDPHANVFSPALARPYFEDKEYHQGEWVLRDFAYWKCLVDIPYPGEVWNEDHWEQHRDILEDIMEPEKPVRWEDIEGKPQVAPLPDRYTDKDVKRKVDEIAGKLSGRTSVLLAALLSASFLFGGVDVQKRPKEDIANDEPIVTDVTYNADPLDTNAVRAVSGQTATNVVGDLVSDWARKPNPAPVTDLSPAFAYTTAVSNKLENSKSDKEATYTKDETDQRILELAKVPGNYEAVSNAALSAHYDATNLVVSATNAVGVQLAALQSGKLDKSDVVVASPDAADGKAAEAKTARSLDDLKVYEKIGGVGDDWVWTSDNQYLLSVLKINMAKPSKQYDGLWMCEMYSEDGWYAPNPADSVNDGEYIIAFTFYNTNTGENVEATATRAHESRPVSPTDFLAKESQLAGKLDVEHTIEIEGVPPFRFGWSQYGAIEYSGLDGYSASMPPSGGIVFNSDSSGPSLDFYHILYVNGMTLGEYLDSLAWRTTDDRTLADYGITDGVTTNVVNAAIAANDKTGTDEQIVRGRLLGGTVWDINVAVAGVANSLPPSFWNEGVHPTTLSGYGITDAMRTGGELTDVQQFNGMLKVGLLEVLYGYLKIYGWDAITAGTVTLPSYLASGDWNTADDPFAKESQIPVISETNLTFSTAVNASISELPASKITSGTFPDSRIASASVWNAKQAELVSGSNIKTINNQSILGPGNIEISVPQPAAAKRYAMFIIRLNETSYDDQVGHFTQFELKASTNNFSTAYSLKDRCCFYSHSGHAEGEFSTNDGMHLFINHGGADQRSYVRIENTAEGMPDYAPAEVIVIVDAALMNRDRSDGSWLYEGNEDVMWTWVRTKDNVREFDGDANHCLWRPISPVRWYSTLPNWAREGL